MKTAFGGCYAGKRVLLTGDSGFKGSWLATWLTELGAQVHGVSLPPQTDPSLFARAGVGEVIEHVAGDIREPQVLADAMKRVEPDVVFHLAAQAIVRESYRDPLGTFATNVMGTANLLEAIRQSGRRCAVVVVSSDKCYDDAKWNFGYRETDRLGGSDPYSASKGCTEIVAASFRRSFFPLERLAEHGVALASARAGNVIGPGDWAKDRLVPDSVVALAAGNAIPVRNPEGVRPWQHVLEPLSGYLWLGAKLLSDAPAEWCEAWNFGPRPESCQSVRQVADALVAAWGRGSWEHVGNEPALKETKVLRLSIEKSVARLEWSPVWDFDETARRTAEGYRRLTDADGPAAARALLIEWAGAYTAAARSRGLPWAGQA